MHHKGAYKPSLDTMPMHHKGDGKSSLDLMELHHKELDRPSLEAPSVGSTYDTPSYQSSLDLNPVWIQCKCIIKEPTNLVWIQSNCATKKVANPVWTQWNFTAALRVRTLCGFRRFGGRLPPLWGIRLLVVFLPWRTAREFLPPLRA